MEMVLHRASVSVANLYNQHKGYHELKIKSVFVVSSEDRFYFLFMIMRHKPDCTATENRAYPEIPTLKGLYLRN